MQLAPLPGMAILPSHAMMLSDDLQLMCQEFIETSMPSCSQVMPEYKGALASSILSPSARQDPEAQVTPGY